MSDTVAWLLETTIDGRPAWFKGKMLHSGKSECTFDSTEAVKFATKEQAEAAPAMKSPYHKYIATEHMWCDTTP